MRSAFLISTFPLLLAVLGGCSSAGLGLGGTSASSGGGDAAGASGPAAPTAASGQTAKTPLATGGSGQSVPRPSAVASQPAASATTDQCYKSDPATCAAEYRIFQLTNAFRAQNGLAPLAFSKNVSFVARAWSTAQAQAGTISHDGWPEARLAAYQQEFHSTQFDTNAENVAMMGGASGDIAQQFVKLWIDSPGHRANMLGQSALLGVGLACTQDGSCYGTQIFGFDGVSVQAQ